MTTEKVHRGNRDGRSAGHHRRPETWWMISREDVHGSMEPLVLDHPGGLALALFGFAEEAALYLRFGGLDGDGWRVRESAPGEVASVLSGPCAGANSVALDPLPGVADGTFGLAYVEKERFVARLLGAGVAGRA